MTTFYDNTRISEYAMCGRRSYFRHERDWVPTATALPLVFGLSWHRAMDVVWTLATKPKWLDSDIAKEAMKAFLQCWETENDQPNLEDFVDMDPEDAKKFKGRTPWTAYEMLAAYVEERRSFIISCEEVVSVEQPFAVPLHPSDDSYFYVGRIDKVVRRDRKILGIEHKTTSLYRKDGPFRNDFMDSFSPNRQIDGYLHALHMLHGKDAQAIWVDAALVHKNHHDQFRFLPVQRLLAQLDSWLWETQHYISTIEREKEELRSYRDAVDMAKKHGSFLTAFPKNTSACTLYGNCPYMDLCKSSANPERDWPDAAPEGFREDKWEPFDELHLEKIGLTKDGPKKTAKKGKKK